MTNRQHHNVLERTAQVISDLFSPIVLPAYMMALAMWISPLIVLPEKTRIVSMIVVAVLTALVPTAAILALIKLGRAKDVSLSSRSERVIPYIVGIVCYIATALFLKSIGAPDWLYVFYVGAALAAAVAYFITYRWKISAHSSAVSGVASALLWMGLHGLLIAGPLYWITGSILLCGLVGTSRLILGRHTLAQVLAGYALGFFSEWLVLYLFVS